MGSGGRTLHSLATVNRSGKTDHEATIDVKLPRRRLESYGEGLIVLLRASGKPRLSGLGFTNYTAVRAGGSARAGDTARSEHSRVGVERRLAAEVRVEDG
jgi:hypothetical protein